MFIYNVYMLSAVKNKLEICRRSSNIFPNFQALSELLCDSSAMSPTPKTLNLEV